MNIKSEIRNPKSEIWLLIAILIIAAFLRLYNITEVPAGLYPDEAIYANNGVEAWETGNFKVFYPENNGREGLWPNIIGFFVIKFGHEPWVPRSVAAMFGILTVLGLYFFAKELFGEKIALLSSFLLATSFWHINFSRIGFRAIMAPFFAVWAIYFLLKALNSQKYIFNSVLGGILFGLGFYSYIAFRALPLLILIILFIYWLENKEKMIRKKILLVACLFTLVALIVFAPLGYYFLKNPQDFFGRTTQISIFNSSAPIKDLGLNILKTAGMFNFSGDWNWRHNYAGRPELFWPVGIIFLIGIFLAVKSLIQKSKIKNQNDNVKFKNDEIPSQTDTKILPFAFCLLISWLIIAALPVIISNESLPHALRAILMAPPVFILAGVGGIWLIAKIKNQISKIKIITATRDPASGTIQNSKILDFIIHTSLFIILSLLVFQAYYTYFVKWGKNPNTFDAFSADYVWIAKGLNDLPKELPKYVIVEASGVDVRGIPMPAQTVMFITDTFTPEKQKEKNIYYVLPNQISQIPENSYMVTLK